MVDKSGARLCRILVNLLQAQISGLDKLVKGGIYPSRSDAVREAVKLLLETKKLEKLKEKLG